MVKSRSSKGRKSKKALYRAMSKTDAEEKRRCAAITEVKSFPQTWAGYFEKQYKQHCQLHAINNALQMSLLTSPSPFETCRKKYQALKWKTEIAKGLLEPTAPIPGSGVGNWTRPTVFLVLKNKGYEPCNVSLDMPRTSPDFLPWLETLKGPHILYLCYWTKVFPNKKTMQARLDEVKHCVALLGDQGVILDSELGRRAIPIAKYPHLSHIGSIYRLVSHAERQQQICPPSQTATTAKHSNTTR